MKAGRNILLKRRILQGNRGGAVQKLWVWCTKSPLLYRADIYLSKPNWPGGPAKENRKTRPELFILLRRVDRTRIGSQVYIFHRVTHTRVSENWTQEKKAKVEG